MHMASKTPSFFILAALYQEMYKASRPYKMASTEAGQATLKRSTIENKSHRLMEPIVITHTNIKSMCTRNEWWIVGDIMDEMKEYNALWGANAYRARSSAEYRRSLAGLVRKGILYKTEVPHIYIVNPRYLRRGEPFAVAATTANMLMNRKPTVDMLMDKDPVREFTFTKVLQQNAITSGESM
jgi:hypothetical protein